MLNEFQFWKLHFRKHEMLFRKCEMYVLAGLGPYMQAYMPVKRSKFCDKQDNKLRMNIPVCTMNNNHATTFTNQSEIRNHKSQTTEKRERDRLRHFSRNTCVFSDFHFSFPEMQFIISEFHFLFLKFKLYFLKFIFTF